MPRHRAPVVEQADEYEHLDVLTQEQYALFDFKDPLDPIYTELDYFRSPNDAIKRRINALDMNEFAQAVTIKLLMNYEVNNLDTMDIEDVSFQELRDGKYQSGRSHSDAQVSDRIRALTNMLPSFARYQNRDDISWIIQKHRLLFLELCENVLNNDESKSKIESYLYAIMRVMKRALGSARHILYAKYDALYLMIRDDIRSDEGNNKLNKAELKKGGLIDWNTVIEKQKELERTFQQAQNKQTKQAYTINQDLMLLSLYSLIPPLRAEVRELQFSNEGNLARYERKGNLILFENNDIFLELHEVKKRHGYVKLTLPENLKKIIRESYQLYPRKYVFTNLMKYNDLTKEARPASVGLRLKKMFNGFEVGSSMLRSSYVTYMYAKRPRINFNMKKWMAAQMRTSVTMLESAYHKILDDEPVQPAQQPVAERHSSRPARGEDAEDDDIEVDDEGCVVLVKRRTHKQSNDSYQKSLKNQKNYYEKHKDRIKQKQKLYRQANPYKEARRKILSKLNSSSEYKIKDATMRKYDIKELDNGVFV